MPLLTVVFTGKFAFFPEKLSCWCIIASGFKLDTNKTQDISIELTLTCCKTGKYVIPVKATSDQGGAGAMEKK